MSYFVTSLTCGRYQRIEWKLGNEFLKAKGTVGRFDDPFHAPSVFRFILFVCLFVLRGNRENCKPATWKQILATKNTRRDSK